MGLEYGTPFVYGKGVKDVSGTVQVIAMDEFPSHLPIFLHWGKKGTTKRIIGNLGAAQSIYGVDTFDPDKTYYTHQTRGMQITGANANIFMSERLKPSDAGPNANYTLYIDICFDDIPNYNRNSDGSIVTDSGTGIKEINVTTPTVEGYRVKWLKVFNDTDGIQRGMQGILDGTMTSAKDGAKSKMYPIEDVMASEHGEDYNNNGISRYPITGSDLTEKFLTDLKALPYKVKLVSREDANSTGKAIDTLVGSNYAKVTYKKNSKDPYTKAVLDADAIVPHSWYNEDSNNGDIKFYEFDNTHVYYDNLETVLKKFVEKEVTHLSSIPTTWSDGEDSDTLGWFDFQTDDSGEILDEKHLFNWMTLVSAGSNVPYFAAVADKTVITPVAGIEEITLGEDNVCYLSGGKDGTMDNAEFERLVKEKIASYSDENSNVMNTAQNVESSFWDTGFTHETSKWLAKFIHLRKDTLVHLCTHDDELGEQYLDSADEFAAAVDLMTAVEAMPESDAYGTGVFRATIVVGTMLDKDSNSKHRLTQNFELLHMISNYLGASTGEWKDKYSLDERGNTVLKTGKAYEPDFIPKSLKHSLWGAGAIYSEEFSYGTKAFMALRTVYTDESSVLMSVVYAYGISVVTKIIEQSHRMFSGRTDLMPDQLTTKIVNWFNTQITGRFDADRFDISLTIEFTDEDQANGYSWHSNISMNGNKMLRVMEYTIFAGQKS